jgi:hypothetical protein
MLRKLHFNFDYRLEITNDKHKISLRSKKGLFAIIRLCRQRDQDINFLSILFGINGIIEKQDLIGRKNRSDIAIYPSGNGKFIRLSDENCSIDQSWRVETILTY